MADKEKVLLKLNELPDTPAKIANFLLEHNVKGRRQDRFSCPIAVWTGAYMVTARDIIWGGNLFYDKVQLPAGARRFVINFDQGKYPQLEVG